MAKLIGHTFGADVNVEYSRVYPITRNNPMCAGFCAAVARETVGDDAVSEHTQALMTSEDFSFMLEALPGAMILIGNGDSAALHSPLYDFNDAIIPIGVEYWTRLVETRLTETVHPVICI